MKASITLCHVSGEDYRMGMLQLVLSDSMTAAQSQRDRCVHPDRLKAQGKYSIYLSYSAMTRRLQSLHLNY